MIVDVRCSLGLVCFGVLVLVAGFGLRFVGFVLCCLPCVALFCFVLLLLCCDICCWFLSLGLLVCMGLRVLDCRFVC